jgi:hypothetical protein
VPATTTKLSVSVPRELLARADKLLTQPGEGRSALLTRVLDAAVRAAEDAAIDAQYDRAFREHPISQGELDQTNAITRSAIHSTRRAGRPGGAAV